MIPLIISEKEFLFFKKLVENIANKIEKEYGEAPTYLLGTMVELPRAALNAKNIALHADFFSFGTNDLTQTTLGLSRDDCSKFLPDYLENKIIENDPFISIDIDGVGVLVKMATEEGIKSNKMLKLGICGEHGGDPKSIDFFHSIGLNYVSCSPYRVPIARLAAAQAYLKKK
jgi:pyruvate,orthophosphate dikinase